MRVGLIAPPWVPVPPPTYGGTEAVVDALARGLSERGHDVTLFTVGDSTCDVRRLWFFDRAPEVIGGTVAEAAHVLEAYAALEDMDLIHDHTMLGPLLASLREPGPVVVTTNHSPFTDDLRRMYAELRDRVALIAISRAQRQQAPELPVARVIHHGLDLGDFPQGDGRGGYLFFLGRMAADKGPSRAIRVARRVGMRLVIATKMREAEEKDYFASEVEPMLGDDVQLLSEVSVSERLRLLQGAFALLNPIAWPEPFGLAMIEALACGTPVITGPWGAAPEIVDDGVTGFLCPDEDAMVQAISRVPGLDRSACRRAVEERFSLGRMVDEHIELYRVLLNRVAIPAARRYTSG